MTNYNIFMLLLINSELVAAYLIQRCLWTVSIWSQFSGYMFTIDSGSFPNWRGGRCFSLIVSEVMALRNTHDRSITSTGHLMGSFLREVHSVICSQGAVSCPAPSWPLRPALWGPWPEKILPLRVKTIRTSIPLISWRTLPTYCPLMRGLRSVINAPWWTEVLSHEHMNAANIVAAGLRLRLYTEASPSRKVMWL